MKSLDTWNHGIVAQSVMAVGVCGGRNFTLDRKWGRGAERDSFLCMCVCLCICACCMSSVLHLCIRVCCVVCDCCVWMYVCWYVCCVCVSVTGFLQRPIPSHLQTHLLKAPQTLQNGTNGWAGGQPPNTQALRARHKQVVMRLSSV